MCVFFFFYSFAYFFFFFFNNGSVTHIFAHTCTRARTDMLSTTNATRRGFWNAARSRLGMLAAWLHLRGLCSAPGLLLCPLSADWRRGAPTPLASPHIAHFPPPASPRKTTGQERKMTKCQRGAGGLTSSISFLSCSSLMKLS